MKLRTNPSIPDFTDPIGEALHQLRLNGTFYCRSELTAPWGVELPPFEDRMMFHVVTAGECWLEIEGEEPHLLQQGSLALIPHGQGHIVRSSLDEETTPLFDIPVEQVSERYEIMRHGGNGEPTHLTCGLVRFDHVAGQQLISLLPKVLQIDTREEEEGSWLQSTLRFIAREARELRPGGETVITHLADILIIQAIRSWLDAAPDANRGWLAALRDKQIGRALVAIHREPEKAWSVASLAKEVGMSRSGFSARFTQLVGDSAMRYLTRWRMQLARAELAQSAIPLSVLADRLGYQSEAAFCRAFKREFDVPPGTIRNSNDILV
ncbi:MAG: AraC family transcriptional regulator [gamma proteobacterium symbiont of Ctena orbiculata]|uniref:AraC family transcriptional regulator n=1 Tax=Candidatus Thiodiazotropha taylori TaxID=2792791 RepID=A0A944MAN0_9GAMM|nr:AraC family transcriptional regulator [Candidatus Thiodiazotropha taylori]PUB88875.1 MAG: AraC family transcriptional regulator [gamma proteobacterium symbiont of Ctena orbiculata]MBT2990389.1 AraC family transcriptional regulator [Candidatus Thiodiazotropha taylori]MBT2998042.1 AraC family transcriptional regulator [Candidatus Thiodiazotropha taylori]MBT3002253.1 AraC family transcriptional regulator [Candidatus Thiodiazotropha taylori]